MGKVLKKITSFISGNSDEAVAKATQEASDATQKAEASRLAAEKAQNEIANNYKLNAATDLRQDNSSTVIAGGTASVASAAETDLKKRRAGLGLSSQLGLNA